MLRNVFVVFVVTICASVATVYSAPMDTKTKKVLARLEKMWKVQDTEIVTARIVFRLAHGQKISEPFCKPLTSGQVYEIVNAVDYSDPQKAHDELVKNLFVSNSSLSSVELFYAPPKSRMQTKVMTQDRDKIRPGFDDYITVFDGKNTINVDPLNNQVDVSGGYIYPISMLRFDPSFPTATIRDEFTFQAVDGILTCSFHDENEILIQSIDIVTGLALYNHSQLFNRNIGRDTFQRCFFTSPDGINFPRIVIEVGYEHDKASIVDISLIEESVFNSTISESTFKVPLPADTHVWDHRYNANKPYFEKLNTNTYDVVAEIGEFVDIPEKQMSRTTWIVIIINVIVISLIVWGLCKKNTKHT